MPNAVLMKSTVVVSISVAYMCDWGPQQLRPDPGCHLSSAVVRLDSFTLQRNILSAIAGLVSFTLLTCFIFYLLFTWRCSCLLACVHFVDSPWPAAKFSVESGVVGIPWRMSMSLWSGKWKMPSSFPRNSLLWTHAFALIPSDWKFWIWIWVWVSILCDWKSNVGIKQLTTKPLLCICASGRYLCLAHFWEVRRILIRFVTCLRLHSAECFEVRG